MAISNGGDRIGFVPPPDPAQQHQARLAVAAHARDRGWPDEDERTVMAALGLMEVA